MRLIDAEKLCELARSHTTKSVDCNDIMRFPTANVQEAKHGKWLICMKTGRLECDACGHQTGEILGRQVTDFPEEELKRAEIFAAQEKAKCGKYYEVKAPNYCANCGAKMELGGNKKDELEI